MSTFNVELPLVHIVGHPLVQHKLTLMRDKNDPPRVSASFSTRSACCWPMK